jgi:hypothetical protein
VFGAAAVAPVLDAAVDGVVVARLPPVVAVAADVGVAGVSELLVEVPVAPEHPPSRRIPPIANTPNADRLNAIPPTNAGLNLPLPDE